MNLPAAMRAGVWAAILSGTPSTLHALATARDPLEATKAAGSILLPYETRTVRLILAAAPLHICLSLGWALVLERAGVRRATHDTLAGLAIAAVDLGLVGRHVPRVSALPLGPQIADHIVYGVVVGVVLRARGLPARARGARHPASRRSQARNGHRGSRGAPR